MENTRKFLADLLGEEIYVVNEESDEYSVKSEEEVVPSQVQEKPIEYSGSNSKGVLVIVEENASEDEMNLLDNILKSIKLSRDEIALLQNDSNFLDRIDGLEEINSNMLISFGVTSGKSRLLDIQTKYAPTTVQEKTVIMADSLQLINEEKDLKRMLWNCLQEVF
jgi:DNA polymerase III psi subunit